MLRFRFLTVPFCLLCWCVSACAGTSSGNCPSGTTAYSKNTSDGAGNTSESWCKTASGVAEGPYVRKDAYGATLASGQFSGGIADGAWSFYAAVMTGSTPVLAETAVYSGGKANGEFVGYDSSGKVIWRHSYGNGIPCGIWTDWDAGGKQVSSVDRGVCAAAVPVVTAIDSEWTAPVSSDYGWDGKTCSSGVQVNPLDPLSLSCGSDAGTWYDSAFLHKRAGGGWDGGKASGNWQFWHENGGLAHRGSFAAGLKTGEWKSWATDGWLTERGNYTNDLKDGAWTTWNANGLVRSEETWKGGALDGVQTIWSVTGVPEQKITWKNGIKDGTWTRFHPSGNPAESGEYVSGVRTGIWTFSWPSGKKQDVGPYEKGSRNGHFQEFTEDGEILAEGDWLLDQREGNWTEFLIGRGARIQASGEYVKSLRYGVWTGKYVVSGNSAFTNNFFEGRLHGEAHDFWPDGKPAVNAVYDQGVLHGSYQEFASSGQQIEDGSYWAGKLHGQETRWYVSGQMQSRGKWQVGSRVGLWEFWSESGVLTNADCSQGGPLCTAP